MSLTNLPSNAMVNRDGDLFYPDDADDARYFSAAHGAWPVLPLRFPWSDELLETAAIEFCGP